MGCILLSALVRQVRFSLVRLPAETAPPWRAHGSRVCERRPAAADIRSGSGPQPLSHCGTGQTSAVAVLGTAPDSPSGWGKRPGKFLDAGVRCVSRSSAERVIPGIPRIAPLGWQVLLP